MQIGKSEICSRRRCRELKASADVTSNNTTVEEQQQLCRLCLGMLVINRDRRQSLSRLPPDGAGKRIACDGPVPIVTPRVAGCHVLWQIPCSACQAGVRHPLYGRRVGSAYQSFYSLRRLRSHVLLVSCSVVLPMSPSFSTFSETIIDFNVELAFSNIVGECDELFCFREGWYLLIAGRN